MQVRQIIDDGARARPRLAARIPVFLPVVLGAVSFAPALHAYFAQDDFAFLALVRLLHEPWLLFVHDHFPASLYFRPLGVFVWWLVCAVADAQAGPQYAVNLCLHVGCVAALYALLQRLRPDAWVNGLWAALFAVHPLSVGTALWLSDRFDLMATLFSLLALTAALGYAARPRLSTLVAMLAALLGALLSKELGVVASAATFVALAFAPGLPLSLYKRAIALGSITALTFGWLVYRHMMLSPIPGLSVPLIPVSTFVVGSWRWLETGIEFLVLDPRLPRWGSVLIAIAAAVWLAAAIAARRRRRDAPANWHVAAAVATLCLLPGLVQSPVAVNHLGDIDAQSFWFSLIVASRFFDLALAGLIAVLMLASAPLVEKAHRHSGPRRAVAGALLLSFVAFVPTTRAIAQDYAERTQQVAAPLQSLERTLADLAVPAHACQVYLVGSVGLWGLAGYSDAVAKGLATDPQRIAHCLFSTERPAFTYFVRTGSVGPEDYRPMRPVSVAGNPIPALTLGDVQALYLSMGEGFAAHLPPQALFIEDRDGTFVDVGADVRSGRRPVNFVTIKGN